MEKHPFRVIIVGGSIAGLTLGHCLARAGIDYIVLEKANEVAPQVGASIGLLPHGGRVLDQLGLYEEVEKHIEPMLKTITTCPDGFSWASSWTHVIYERFGQSFAFLERQRLLEILYTRFPDQSKIHLRTRVASVTGPDDNGLVAVIAENGKTYTGGLVVGADGVHSKLAAIELSTEYSCVFGISPSIKGLNTGEQTVAMSDGAVILTAHGKNGRIYWFLIEKLDRQYIYPDHPRLGPQDAASSAERYRHHPLCNGATFGQLWDTREIATMTPLEEGLPETWYYNRMVLIGDSAHKMTPNLGQGANMAIEDAAKLATLIHALVHGTKNDNRETTPEPEAVTAMLQEYQASRYPRIRSTYNMSRAMVRVQTRDSFLMALLGRYLVPHANGFIAYAISQSIADGEICGFLPLRLAGGAWDEYRSRTWAQRRIHPDMVADAASRRPPDTKIAVKGFLLGILQSMCYPTYT
ncbi:FAD-dependent oxidoreductase [Aspergillus stella-maris]|uniref:FAD-dependent oxidoreductase n=1 Tax=Aspergillus stella-maris TaxID=1810926 RepID=UPI003CCDF5D7